MLTNRCLWRFRPLGTRALRALVPRALNLRDTSWSAFNYYKVEDLGSQHYHARKRRRTHGRKKIKHAHRPHIQAVIQATIVHHRLNYKNNCKNYHELSREERNSLKMVLKVKEKEHNRKNPSLTWSCCPSTCCGPESIPQGGHLQTCAS